MNVHDNFEESTFIRVDSFLFNILGLKVINYKL